VPASADVDQAWNTNRIRQGMPELHWRRLADGNPYRGRKKALVDNQVVKLRRRAGAGEQRSTLAREFGISQETLYQYLKVEPTP
jgi:DNA invertase Pin-like site-specific DNA recombinase